MPERPRVLVLHGPNLGALGSREPDVYGHETLADIDASLVALGDSLGLAVETAQHNGEGQLIDRIHSFAGAFAGAFAGGSTSTDTGTDASAQMLARSAIPAAQAQHTGSAKAPARARGLVFNPGGYTHTSVALRDAIAAVALPTIEVHLSNLYAREAFRHTSITGGACRAVIMGLGSESYRIALVALAKLL